MEDDIDNQVSALETRKGLLRRLKTPWTLPPTAKNWTGVFTHPPKIMRFSQLNGNFNGLYLRNETCHTIWQLRWKLRKVSYIVSKWCELWSTNGLKLDRSFYPPSENSAFFFIAGLRTRSSDHRTQPNFVT